jgi:hypothetical protein
VETGTGWESEDRLPWLEFGGNGGSGWDSVLLVDVTRSSEFDAFMRGDPLGTLFDAFGSERLLDDPGLDEWGGLVVVPLTSSDNAWLDASTAESLSLLFFLVFFEGCCPMSVAGSNDPSGCGRLSLDFVSLLVNTDSSVGASLANTTIHTQTLAN